ncbi:hypothetical protein Leryth_011041 [Lithospermum erythrorhizon]|nr:hypothetical protein Leryth_011041 [Lithospermum erythrorhizon]
MSSRYPEVDQSNPNMSTTTTTTSSLYPNIQMQELAENLFPDDTKNDAQQPACVAHSTTFHSSEEVLIKIPGTLLHLIDKDRSVELASGEFTIVRLLQGGNVVAVLARVGDEIQWPLARDEAAVKLDESHYFFTLRVPNDDDHDEVEGDHDEVEGGSGKVDIENLLNYGLTIAAKGQEEVLSELDKALREYTAFRVEEVVAEMGEGWWSSAKDVTPQEMEEGEKKELMEKSSEAYWTTLAPNVEDYSSWVARAIAASSGHVIRGILWCGDVTVERLKWGDEFLKRKLGKAESSQMSPRALRRIKRVKKLTQMTEEMATGVLGGVVKVSGFFTSSIANSKVGQKFFSLLPGEIILASLDGFNKVCDAVEVAGKNVMSTTAVVTTALVSQRHGEPVGEVTREGFDAAGHAIGTAWAVFKIRNALNPKNVLKPTKIAKATAKASLKEKQKNKDSPTSLA